MLRLPLNFIVNLTSKGIALSTTLSDDEDILQIFMAILIHIKSKIYLIQDLEENYTEYYKAPIPYYIKELFNA